MSALVCLRDVGRTYPGPVPVIALAGCTLTIAAGEYLAVMGPSGSGKSTLLGIMGLLDNPTEGTYQLSGRDVTTLSSAEQAATRATRIGFVFQSFHLLPYRDAAANAGLGLMYRGMPPHRRRQAALAALDRLGLAHRAHARPGELSGGERQRVAIARAIACEPDLLLCDEPTGNLDSATGQAVLSSLASLHQDGRTIVVITHDDTVAAQAQRIVRLRDGRIESPGTA